MNFIATVSGEHLRRPLKTWTGWFGVWGLGFGYSVEHLAERALANLLQNVIIVHSGEGGGAWL